MPVDVFISHAHKDEVLVAELYDFLKDASGLKDQNIRCTSDPRGALVIGDDIYAQLREDIDSSFVFIPVITKNSLNSNDVMFEIGAAWGLYAKILPVRCKVALDKIPEILRGLTINDLSEKESVVQLGEVVRSEAYGSTNQDERAQISEAATRFFGW